MSKNTVQIEWVGRLSPYIEDCWESTLNNQPSITMAIDGGGAGPNEITLTLADLLGMAENCKYRKPNYIKPEMKVAIGNPNPNGRIIVDAEIIRCKNPVKSYSKHIAIYEESNRIHLGNREYNKTYSNYDSLPEIKEGDLILSQREDEKGLIIVIQIQEKEEWSKCTDVYWKVVIDPQYLKGIEIETSI